MKKIVSYFILTTLCCPGIFAQKLTLSDLTVLCSKKNWEDVNQTLRTKGWSYYDSEKGNTNKYNTITWSYNKDQYSDKAQAWFYLYTYEGYPNKVSYSVFNKEVYSVIQNSITPTGFKLINSEIEDNQIISTYANTNYTLKISTEKRDMNDHWKTSHTAYNITVIKKAGIYDLDNGKKTEYYYGNKIKVEYTLLNGKINGQVKTYHYNGNIKKTGNYSNGIENGLFKEYDDNGSLEAEYSMSNGKINGQVKTYHYNGNIKKTGNYSNGIENGLFKEYDDNGNLETECSMSNGKKNGKNIYYYYNDETGELQVKAIGEYLDNEMNGRWENILIQDGNEHLLNFKNYTEGIKNGPFQEIKGDSLIVGSYRNDELHGEYKIYLDFNRLLFGGITRTDTAKLTLINEGNYFEGLKSDYWKNYHITGILSSEGRFSNGQKTGEWKYYYANYINWIDGNREEVPYSRQLFLIQNYSNGKLDGKSTRYSYLNEEKYPCNKSDDSKSSSDTCKRYVYEKVLETSFYKNDKLNGAYELKDSLNEVIAKGFFKDNLKDGMWLHKYNKDMSDTLPAFLGWYRYNNKDIYDAHHIYQKGNYLKDEREGEWIQYYTEGKITETFNYKNGELHGEYIVWNRYNKPGEKKQFTYGKLTELIIYDSSGINMIIKYEIYNEKSDSYNCRKTEYYKDGSTSQEYWIKKLEDEINHDIFEAVFVLSVEKIGGLGYEDGDFKQFNSNNQPITTGKRYKKDRVGLWTFYFYEQNIKIESNYTLNNQSDEKYFTLNGEVYSGEFVYSDNENGIKEIRKIKAGLRNGKTTYIDIKTNKTVKKENYKNGELK